jgi:ABC-type phosphate transport system ATPase subunit
MKAEYFLNKTDRPVAAKKPRRIMEVFPGQTLSMFFQEPNPFPKAVFENIAYGSRVRAEKRRQSSSPF